MLQERMQERMEREMGLGDLLLRDVGGWMREKLETENQSDDKAFEELFASMGLDGGYLDGDDNAEKAWSLDGKVKRLGRSPWLGEISVVESEYLTMSWWLLHIGWKDVDERVKRRKGSVQWASFILYYIYFCRRWHRAENVFF